MVAYLSMTLIASILLRWLEKRMDGSNNYDLVNEDQLVGAAGTYNHPAKGSPSDEHSKEAAVLQQQQQLSESCAAAEAGRPTHTEEKGVR